MICEHCGTVFCWDEADEGGGPKLYCSKACAQGAWKKRKRQRAGESSAHFRQWLESSLQACVEQGKRQYMSEDDAQAAAAAIFSRKAQPLRVYRCPGSKHWHVTSLSSNHRRMSGARP